MKKSELRSGMGVVRRDGSNARLIEHKDKLWYVTPANFGRVGSVYSEDLVASEVRAWDIVKVHAAPHVRQLLNPEAHGELLWEREEGPELPKYYRLMKEGEVLGKFDKFWQARSWVDAWRYVGQTVGCGVPHCTPDIEVPEGYELWHVAGEEAPGEEIPIEAELLTADDPRDRWSESCCVGCRMQACAAADFHYIIPIAKPQEEKMVTVNGREFSESTVAAALREYVK